MHRPTLAHLSAVSLSTLVLVACGDPTLWTPLPESPGVQSFVLAYGTLGDRTLAATGVADWTARTVTLDGDDARIEAWAYTQTLDELQLPGGDLKEDSSGGALREPNARWVFDESEGTWRADPSPILLMGVRVEHTTRCTQFEVEVRELGDGRTFLLSPMPDGRLLHGFSRHIAEGTTLRSVDADGGVDVLSTPAVPYATSAAVLADSLWIGTLEGQIAEVSLTDLETISSSASDPTREWHSMAGGLGPAGREIYAASNWGDLVRVVSGALETIAAAQSLAKGAGNMVWRGPGEVYLATPVRRSLLHLDDGMVLEEELPMATGSPECVVSRDRYGLLAGTTTGEIHRRLDGRWRPLVGLPEYLPAASLLELPEGLLIGGSGEIREWREADQMLCPRIEVPGATKYTYLERVGTLIIAAGRPAVVDGSSQLVILRPVAAAKSN